MHTLVLVLTTLADLAGIAFATVAAGFVIAMIRWPLGVPRR